MKKRAYLTSYSILILSLLVTMGIRAVPTVITVTTTSDSGAGSLRQAILDINSDPLMPHIINFSINSGLQTISPLSALPPITSSYTLIDGTSQPEWSSNPIIVIDGSLVPPYTTDGITLSGVHNCLIHGLAINNGFNNGILITDNGIGSNNNAIIECFIGTDYTGTYASPNYNGITINGSTNVINNGNIIGDASLTLKNLISGNANCGVILTTNVNNTAIQNNFIGTDITGTCALSNSKGGISITGSFTPVITEQCLGNIIRNNLISGNSIGGILLQANTVATIIQGNLIGVDTTGIVALPNDVGVISQGLVPPDPSNPTNGAVMNTDFSGYNTISGNSSHGIVLTTNSLNTTLEGNFIGTDTTGTLNLGNGGHGILIQGSTNAPCTNTIVGANEHSNIIAFNGTSLFTPCNGVLIAGDATTPDIINSVLKNTIVNNSGAGIALLNNSNHLQSPPTILKALLNTDGDLFGIVVTAPSTPSDATFRLDFFINNADRSPITEGQSCIASIPALPAGQTTTLIFPLSSPIAPNLWASATATNLNNLGSRPGDTSPFSNNVGIETIPNNIPLSLFQ